MREHSWHHKVAIHKKTKAVILSYRTVMMVAIWCLSCFFLIFVVTTIHAQGCIKDFQEIQDRETKVVNSINPRRYIVCANTIINIGDLDFNNNLRIPKPFKKDSNATNDATTVFNPPLPLRPNMNIRCGDDGSKNNQCVITGGHLQIDGTSTRGITDSTVNNIIIEGFIFEGATKSSMLVDKPGNLLFRNCEWRVRYNCHILLADLCVYWNWFQQSDTKVYDFLVIHFQNVAYLFHLLFFTYAFRILHTQV